MDFTNGFKIIGLSVRTSNNTNQSQNDLAELWQNFYSENVSDKIPNKLSTEILEIYTDYKSDYTEDYTTILGIPVSTLDEIPEGLVGREFPKENFKKCVAKGSMPNAVQNKWKEIWKNNAQLNRKYTYDLEVYDEKSQNGDNSEVAIYIAVK